MWAIITFILFSHLAKAHISSTVTCLSTFQWTYNSKGQSPCLIAAYLQAECSQDGSFVVPPLPNETHYSGTAQTESNSTCQCSSVVYSLMSACAICQARTFIGWSSWATNCSVTYLSLFSKGIPKETAVPAWAYLDVSLDGHFNVTNAERLMIAGIPESTSINPTNQFTSPTTNSSTGISTSTPQMEPPVATTVTGPMPAMITGGSMTSPSNSSNKVSENRPVVDAIIAISVIVVILILCGLYVLWSRRHHRMKGHSRGSSYEQLLKPEKLISGDHHDVLDITYNAVAPTRLETMLSQLSLPSNLYDPSDGQYSPAEDSSDIHTAHKGDSDSAGHGGFVVNGNENISRPLSTPARYQRLSRLQGEARLTPLRRVD